MPRRSASEPGAASCCLTDEERAIVAALRNCPESALSAYPEDKPLPMTSVAWVLGLTDCEARYLLESGMRRIAAAIGRDPEFLELISDYYTSHQTKDND